MVPDEARREGGGVDELSQPSRPDVGPSAVPPIVADDIVAGLNELADAIESGEPIEKTHRVTHLPRPHPEAMSGVVTAPVEQVVHVALDYLEVVRQRDALIAERDALIAELSSIKSLLCLRGWRVVGSPPLLDNITKLIDLLESFQLGQSAALAEVERLREALRENQNSATTALNSGQILSALFDIEVTARMALEAAKGGKGDEGR